MRNVVRGRKEAGYVEGWLSVLANTSLFIVKYITGVMFNSIAIIADAIHTLSDSLTSIIVIISFWAAYRPPDKEHPFGHGRTEQVGSIVIGTLLAVVGWEFCIRSYDKLINKQSMTFNWLLIAVLLTSALVKELLARFSLKLSVRYDSKSLAADAWHHRSDAIASALIAVAALLGRDVWWVDGVLGISVSILIIYVAVKVIYDSSKEILGYAPTPDLERDIVNVVTSISKDVKDVHHIHIHKYGEHIEVTLHIRLPPNTKLLDAHEIASKVERELKMKYGWEVTVHIEPHVGT